jgi:hypothetical protein
MSAGKLIRVENTNWNGKPAQPELSSSRRTEFLWLCGEWFCKGMERFSTRSFAPKPPLPHYDFKLVIAGSLSPARDAHSMPPAILLAADTSR